ICRRNCPLVTICPSFTASCVMRPLTSEATSTLVCGATCPLAVTDATRSRLDTFSSRTSVAWLLPFFTAATTTSASTAGPATMTTYLVRLVIAVLGSAKRTPHRALQRGERPVIIEGGGQQLLDRALVVIALRREIDGGRRSDAVLLLRELQRELGLLHVL